MGTMKLDVRHGPTSRRYSLEQKGHAVRMVFALREELGSSSGTVTRAHDHAAQLRSQGREPS